METKRGSESGNGESRERRDGDRGPDGAADPAAAARGQGPEFEPDGEGGPEERERAGFRARAREVGDRVDEIGARGFGRLAEILEQGSEVIEERTGEGGDGGPVAEPMRRASRYFATRSPRGALSDLDGAIQRHPYRSMAIGAGVGWLLGRITRRLRAG